MSNEWTEGSKILYALLLHDIGIIRRLTTVQKFKHFKIFPLDYHVKRFFFYSTLRVYSKSYLNLLKTVGWRYVDTTFNLWPKNSKTLFRPVNVFRFFKELHLYIKINSKIWFGPVNSNFHFENCFQQFFSLIMAVSFTCQGNQCMQRRPLTVLKEVFLISHSVFTCPKSVQS